MSRTYPHSAEGVSGDTGDPRRQDPESRYFPEDLCRAIGNLQSYLAGPGSLLLIVRTLGSGEHHGTLFVLDEHRRLRVRQRFGKGSEIEQLALQI